MTTAVPVTSLTQVRRRFPAFERQVKGNPVAYFDAPGGTQVPDSVADAVRDYLLHHNANTHWAFDTSAETDAMIVRARQAAADLLGASADEIAFGANMTTLAFHVARGLGRQWGPGDEVIITELDHHANVAPWQALARERGITLRTVPLSADLRSLDFAAFQRMLGPRTRLVAVGAASNAIGTITDAAVISKMAHAAGALVFTDAVHFAPHDLVDVRAMGSDLLACSAYKFCGPHVGLLYVRRELGQQVDVPKLEPAPNSAPERFETGTLNHEGIAGVEAAVNFLAELGGGDGTRRQRLEASYAWLHRQGETLFRQMWEGLSAIPGVQLYGHAPGGPRRTPTVAFTVGGMPSSKVASALASDGVFVSDGDFYASTVVERLGLAEQGLVRAGCACYTTEEEVGRLVEGVRALRAKS
ncbi:MAG TPA: cysteine desulfurase-like protein [Gemmatimonadales bacterium]|nr:cysteine desulfurase-like protein [Gemmatimonadales bacterium]